MRSHASLPVPLRVEEDLYRVYFAARDGQNRSHVGFVEFSIQSPTEILRVSSEPVLTPGGLGRFDDHGVYAASLAQHERELFLYYIGWNPGARGPLFYSSIGLAASNDGGLTFQKKFAAPIMARSEFDPCLVTSPCVIRDDDKWRMWYVSGFKWEEDSDGMHSYYHIKYAESSDAITWNRQGLVAIDLENGERNIARPCVIKDSGIYKMWYSYNRGLGYRIGYAESEDGYVWKRMEEHVGIDVSASGWDSEAIAYPWVFSHDGSKYMLYNGNGFGRDGFGLAVAE